MANLTKYIALLGVSILLIACNKTLQITDSNSSNQSVSANIAASTFADSIIAPYRDSMKASMDEVLNETLVDLEVGVPEGLLGDFVTDLTFDRTRNEAKSVPDFCILNNGGLRTPVLKGAITRGKIFELMPFENEIVIVEISPDKMLDLIEYVRSKSLMGDSRKAGVPVSNFRMQMSNGKVSNIMINNRQYSKHKNYKVVTTDYLANGGDNMNFFLNPINIEKTGLKLRDIIIDHVIELKKRNIAINLALDGRIHNAE
ncbi:MAG: 5'-nucleotidase C-terminal domain-containing protein [Flavobacteriales bacterium]|jgi:2',3'-cyclic-nucleotide 2'-phosphodiesterase (5'-nucleotidase family)|nr:5'-nucleotidase C-terminal domain-containing protein [Flavobacteriales bacterium]